MFFYPELIGIAYNDELLLNYQTRAPRNFGICLYFNVLLEGTLELLMTFCTKLFMPKIPSARRSSMVWKI